MRGAATVPMDPSVGALTVTSLTDETSQGVYCRRMRISALQCRQAWLGLCDFIFAQLKNQKGVSLPGLGSFAVGACVDTANGGVVEPRAPVFAFSQKFDAVPQARGRFFLAKPATYARVSTTAIAARCGVHKAGVAHVLKEMLSAIADRIMRGEPVDIDFSFARLVARRDDGTRAEMRFFPGFLEREMGLSAEVPGSVPGAPRDRTFLPSRSENAKARRDAIPAKVTGTTPALETAAAATRAADDAADAFAVETRLAPVAGAFAGTHADIEHGGGVFNTLGPAAFSSSVSPAAATRKQVRPQSARRVPSPAAAATPAGAAFLEICARLDRLRVGHVERLRLERVLNDDKCEGLVSDVPVSVVRDTLRAASCGREGKFVAYLPVCRALEAASAAARAARAAAAESAAARVARLREEQLAAERASSEMSETEAVAEAAKRLAAAAIANVIRGPEDPAEPIAELFLSSRGKTEATRTPAPARGAGVGFVGENLEEVTKFNLEYAAARSRFVAASAGGVTPKVTSNRAVELSAGERETTNELGRFLQSQIDARETRLSAEKASRVAEEEARNREASKILALEKVAIAQSKKQSAEALRAGWDEQTSAKKEQKKKGNGGRPPVRLVKFDALK